MAKRELRWLRRNEEISLWQQGLSLRRLVHPGLQVSLLIGGERYVIVHLVGDARLDEFGLDTASLLLQEEVSVHLEIDSAQASVVSPLHRCKLADIDSDLDSVVQSFAQVEEVFVGSLVIEQAVFKLFM